MSARFGGRLKTSGRSQVHIGVQPWRLLTRGPRGRYLTPARSFIKLNLGASHVSKVTGMCKTHSWCRIAEKWWHGYKRARLVLKERLWVERLIITILSVALRARQHKTSATSDNFSFFTPLREVKGQGHYKSIYVIIICHIRPERWEYFSIWCQCFVQSDH